jgi:hypothetical protein
MSVDSSFQIRFWRTVSTPKKIAGSAATGTRRTQSAASRRKKTDGA